MSNVLKSAYENEPLRVVGYEIDCAVLEDKTRVISQSGINRSLGIGRGGSGAQKIGGEVQKLPRFLSLKALKPYIGDELTARIENPIEYVPLHGGRTAFGIPAECFSDVCQVWIDADKDGVLTGEHKETAEKAKILKKAVEKVGWVALVDEATGYQKVRDKDALQGLLSLYIAKEFQPHLKTFIDAFYEEIYRLKRWDYNPKKNKYQVVGKYTLKYVYGCLPSAVVETVNRKTPRDKSGNYTKKLFQSLTHEVGKPHLDRALGGVIALMKASSTWEGFKRNFARAYGEQQHQLQLPLELLDEEDVATAA